MAVKPIPEGYHTLNPYIVAKGANQLVDFLKSAFGAKELFRMSAPDGSIGHAELQLGDSRLMVGEAREPWKPMACSLYLYVPDTDAAYQAALRAGGKSLMEPGDQFYGDRNAGVTDPCGNMWWIATHIEDVSHDELMKRAAAREKAA